MAKKNCIKPGSKLDQDKKRFQARFMADGVAADQAEQMAENMAVSSAKADRARRVANALDSAKKRKSIGNLLKGKKGNDLFYAVLALIKRNENGKYNEVTPVHWVRSYYRGTFKAMNKSLEESFFGLRGDAILKMNEDIKKELWAIENDKPSMTSNPAARKAAEGIAQTLEAVRTELNDKGMGIGDLTNYLYPHSWVPEKLAKDNGKQFIDMLVEAYNTPGKMVPLLDEQGVPILSGARLVEHLGKANKGQSLEEIVAGMADSIMSGDVVGTDVGALPSAIGNSYRKPRIIQFKDQELRRTMEEMFGEPDLRKVMASHIESASRSLSMIDTFGVNPDVMFRDVYDGIISKMDNGLTNKQRKQIEKAYKAVAGHYDRINDPGIARLQSGVMQGLSSVQLSGALVSQVSDFTAHSWVYAMNNIPVFQGIRRYFEMFPKKLTPKDMSVLRIMNIEVEALNAHFADISGDGGRTLMEKAAEFTYYWSGTKNHASSSNISVQLNLLNKLSDISEMGLAEADAAINGKLSQYGIGEQEWNLIRKAPKQELWGEHFVSGGSILEHYGQEASAMSSRFSNFVNQLADNQVSTADNILNDLAAVTDMPFAEANKATKGILSDYGLLEKDWKYIQASVESRYGKKFANIDNAFKAYTNEIIGAVKKLTYYMSAESNIATSEVLPMDRALMQGFHEKGTAGAMAFSLATQYKGFAIRYTRNMLGEMARMTNPKDKAALAAHLVFTGTLLGMIALQTKRLLKGQGLADFENPRTFGAAFIQGSGAGIFGDFIVSGMGENRYGHTFLNTLAGPAAGLLDDTVKLFAGNLGQAARGERANFASEAIKYAGRYAPGASMPFFGLAAQRLIVDQLRLMADRSGTTRSFMSESTREKTDFGAEAWWKRGQILPEFLR